MYVRISVDSRPHRGKLRASYARAGNELCDLKNRRRLVADVIRARFACQRASVDSKKSPAIPKIRAMLDGTSGVLRPARFQLARSSPVARPCAAESRPIFGRTSHESRLFLMSSKIGRWSLNTVDPRASFAKCLDDPLSYLV
ncbi:hypothetical protein Bbelb_194440 [Branchiostoma belcheri]|nr:hypothetical protein Bbelb_194440 [Branchiostoma belcheri]